MSKMIEINLKPDDRTLRQFGIIALVGFGFVAAIGWFDLLIFAAFPLGSWKTAVCGTLAALAGIAALFSLVYPKANLPIYLALTILSFPIGFVLSYVIMGTLFFLIIGPIAVLFRVFGRDPMHRDYDESAPTYWQAAKPARDKESYFHQY